MTEIPQIPEKPSIKFDAGKIKYDTEQDTVRYGEKNRQFCDALNSGRRFSIVFTEPLSNERITTYKSCSDGDLYYARVVLPDKKIMPYPLFQQAGGVEFNPKDKNRKITSYHDSSNWEQGNWVGSEDQQMVISEMKVTLDELEYWMTETFGKQFAGTTECATSWDDLEEVAKAVEKGAEMAKSS